MPKLEAVVSKVVIVCVLSAVYRASMQREQQGRAPSRERAYLPAQPTTAKALQ